MLQRVAVRYSVLQCVAVRCSALQCVAVLGARALLHVRCNVLQCLPHISLFIFNVSLFVFVVFLNVSLFIHMCQGSRGRERDVFESAQYHTSNPSRVSRTLSLAVSF